MVADTDWLRERYNTYESALKALSPSRRDKALSYKFDKDQELSVLASVLLNWLLRRRGLREKDMTYAVSDLGKPSFIERPNLYFSIAHSAKMAAVILGSAPVGADVEYLPDFPRDLANPFMWTEMECVGKLLGHGVGCYVDGKKFDKPDDVKTKHIPFGDYLLCAAWKTKL